MAGQGNQAPGILSPFADRLSHILAYIQGDANSVDGGHVPSALTPAGASPSENWRLAEANLYLDLEGPTDPAAEFLFPAQGAYETSISLNSLATRDLQVSIGCDGVARLYGVAAHPVHIRAGKVVDLTLERESHAKVHLTVGPEVTTCNLSWGDGHQMALRHEDLARPDLARLDARETYCASPEPARMDALEAAFYADRWLSQTCAQATGNVTLLSDSVEALNARFEALTGRKVSKTQLMQGDPDMALDFSQAPQLDLIYVSYLLLRADYTGALLKRMLAWHAARGSIVRILVADRLMLDLDRALYEDLAARFPNVQIQYFKWTKPGLKTPGDLIDTVQLSHHIKIFATLSRQPGRSRFIVGGRNHWDGFFFDDPFDMTAYPELRTYNTDADAFFSLLYHSIYEDFEITLQGDEIVKDFMAHLSTFWHRDTRSHASRTMSVAGPVSGAPRDGRTRHFMSLPWADNHAQEAFVVELLDAAQKEITIVSPFMYPTPAIVNAMLRARARGVPVIVVLRVDSTDPSGAFVTALNRGFVQDWAGDFEVYEYVPGRRMLHTKLILIDGRLSVVTSSNLNRRSFLYDSENGLVFLDRAVTARLQAVVDGYLVNANRQVPGGELPLFDRTLNSLTDLWRYF